MMETMIMEMDEIQFAMKKLIGPERLETLQLPVSELMFEEMEK